MPVRPTQKVLGRNSLRCCLSLCTFHHLHWHEGCRHGYEAFNVTEIDGDAVVGLCSHCLSRYELSSYASKNKIKKTHFKGWYQVEGLVMIIGLVT